jgi:hypothetical protein
MKLVSAALMAAALVPLAAGGQEPPVQQAVRSAATIEPYVPKIGEIMALQQMRHIKLWFAGSAGNWPLADYELDELKEGFDGVNEQLGGGTVENAVGAQMAALAKAVDVKDRTAFAAAFDDLSAGCNTCHEALDHAFIVIQRPTSLPYSDQLFATQK